MSKKKKTLKIKKVAGAVFNYTSVCCGKPAKKPALVWTPEDQAARKFSEGSLGHWRCTNCERPCKVTRSRVKLESQGIDDQSGSLSGQQGAAA